MRNRIVLRAAALAALAVPTAAHAQLRAVRTLSTEAVRKALQAAEAEARRQGWSVSVAVVDGAGELAGFLRLDGAPPSSVAVSQAKARSAARFRRPTAAMDSALVAGRTAFLVIPDAMPVAGGVPIVVDGEVVGAVGVSGVTSAQDAQVARAGAAVVVP